MRHIKRLLALGMLPVSVDYRLCPEVTLEAGALADSVDAIAWARTLPPSQASRSPVDIATAENRLAVVGWSVGGHLGMTAVATCGRAGVKPPDAIVAFYAPSDYEDDCEFCSFTLFQENIEMEYILSKTDWALPTHSPSGKLAERNITNG